MAVPAITALNMSDIKLLGNLARTNLYQVTIDGGWGELPSQYGQTFLPYDITDFSSGFKGQLALLCSEATLPASSYATAEVKDNFMGVPQEFAHTRINTDIDFTFYIDRDYKVLMFFEAWMDYISGGNNPNLKNQDGTPNPEPSLTIESGNYYRRFKYPRQYKTSQFYIKKFEKDWQTSSATNISYQLINAFPKSIASIPIAYGEAEIMKVTVTMNYDRYIPRREYASVIYDQQQFQQSIDPGITQGNIPGTTTVGQTGSAVINPGGGLSDLLGGPGDTGAPGLS
jgi:hypothetical protein